jgi:outer membrane protein assembly factor BamE (lipoprotein component of BamABCDE complex)
LKLTCPSKNTANDSNKTGAVNQAIKPDRMRAGMTKEQLLVEALEKECWIHK